MEVGFGSRCFGADLRWSASYRCLDCDWAMEEDDYEVPSDWRDLELKLDGAWSVQISDETFNVPVLLKVVRVIEGMSLVQVSAIKRSLPGPFLLGTKAEMERVCCLLKTEGISAEVVKKSGT